jgi:tetratricopeptide (TPR) repeat protein
VRLLEQARAQAEELGGSERGRQIMIFQARLSLVRLGRFEEALDLAVGGDTKVWERTWTALCLAHAGKIDDASGLMAEAMAFRIDQQGDETPAGLLALVLELAIMIRDTDHAAALAKRPEPLAGLAAVHRNLVCVARLLGGAAALSAKPERAEAYYEQALAVAARAGNRPEAALTHLQMAELLLDDAGSGTQRTEALEHLDFAISEFRAMKMQPALERALRHKDVLKA